jgi:hypothetical protein
VQEPQQLLVCRVCHFHALDGSGLLQHLSNSTHCSSSAPGHSIPSSIDLAAADNNCINNNSMSLMDEDFSGGDFWWIQ